LKVYFQSGKAKLTLAIAKGKRKYDKRDSIRRRDQERDFERSKKEYK
jgi:SsrA-binding protein